MLLLALPLLEENRDVEKNGRLWTIIYMSSSFLTVAIYVIFNISDIIKILK